MEIVLLISVVIPTYNRTDLLLEACKSIANQSYDNWEAVVIDDGSASPIPESSIKQILGNKFRLFRNDKSQGIPKTKNIGIKHALGEIVLILDDDDLLTTDAFKIIHDTYERHPELDCLFLGVEPFGKYSKKVSVNRERQINKIIEHIHPREIDGIYLFDNSLFDELLNSVPIDFQRPAARKGTWNILGGFNEGSLFSESNWAIKASIQCKTALTRKQINLWRIHDKNFGWKSEFDEEQNKIRQFENGIFSGALLLQDFIKRNKALRQQINKIKHYHSEQHFNLAYFYRNKNKKKGIKFLLKSFFLYPDIIHLRLIIFYIIPKNCLRHFQNDKDM